MGDIQAPPVIPTAYVDSARDGAAAELDVMSLGRSRNRVRAARTIRSTAAMCSRLCTRRCKPHGAISSGVMEGMLIGKVLPVYPAMARAMRIAGRVELQATISRNGTIENLRVVSGPAMLQQAALDAVRQWRYRPYLLNGEPVEVETTINVDFKLD